MRPKPYQLELFLLKQEIMCHNLLAFHDGKSINDEKRLNIIPFNVSNSNSLGLGLIALLQRVVQKLSCVLQVCCAQFLGLPRRSVKSHAWPKHVYFITQHVARRLVTVGDCCETAL